MLKSGKHHRRDLEPTSALCSTTLKNTTSTALSTSEALALPNLGNRKRVPATMAAPGPAKAAGNPKKPKTKPKSKASKAKEDNAVLAPVSRKRKAVKATKKNKAQEANGAFASACKKRKAVRVSKKQVNKYPGCEVPGVQAVVLDGSLVAVRSCLTGSRASVIVFYEHPRTKNKFNFELTYPKTGAEAAEICNHRLCLDEYHTRWLVVASN